MNSQKDDGRDLFPGTGAMPGLMRALDWSATRLGRPEEWPESLRSTLSICLGSRFPIAIYWGPELTLLYNDAWSPILGGKHPDALGRPALEVWPEIWDAIGPAFTQVMTNGEATYAEDSLLAMNRHGYTEECYFNYSFTPIRGATGQPEGVFNAVIETTYRVVAERRRETLRLLSDRLVHAPSVEEVCTRAVEVLGTRAADATFAAVFLIDTDGKWATLEASAGIGLDLPAASPKVAVGSHADVRLWDFARASVEHRPIAVPLTAHFAGTAPGGPWPEAGTSAIVAPMLSATGQVIGFIVLGASSRRAVDDPYLQFAAEVASVITTAVAGARAFEEERRRVEALAEIDRAKTNFFSDVSHELRTPLTLMLGPLTDLLERHDLPTGIRGELDVAQRNGLRLLKLVNNLLDFTRIEAGRVEAAFEPTDLAELTAGLASTFRSAIEKTGVSLRVDAAPLGEPVYVDREMWERVVLNLVSNAFKHTFAGSIDVKTTMEEAHAVLQVTDTGVGIPETDVARIFERFHRVRGTRSRTIEGTGIGLALVQEIVRIHQGTIDVTSRVGTGTTFTVRIPRGERKSTPLVIARVSPERRTVGTSAFVAEAARWSASEPTKVSSADQEDVALSSAEYSRVHGHERLRVLVADDNADMRDYVARVLAPHFEVDVAPDGAAALRAVQTRVPDLVLSDVMMPGLDGFQLIKAMRESEQTASVPVILLSARAGEESAVEGLAGGASDYLVKPFSSRELVARVATHIAFGKARAAERRAERRFRALFQEAPVAVALLAGPDLRYEIANPRYCEIAGRADVVGRSVREVFPELPEDTPEIEILRNVRASGVTFTDAGYRVPLRRGAKDSLEDAFFHVTVQPFANGPGEADAVFLVAVDVTEQVVQRRSIEDLARREQAARRHAEEANRLKDEFLATVSHELRTPLNTIVGWSALLRSSRAGDPQWLAKGIEVIDRSARAQALIIDDILDVSRIVTGKLSIDPTPQNLATTLREAVESLRHAATAKGITLNLDAVDALHVVCDAGRMRQVVWNLLTNAIRHTDKGGVITASLRALGSHVQLAVTDNGLGIEPEFLPYVWDRFRQADGSTTRVHGGLGLGLSIVRHIVDMHGGWVRAESGGLGHGASFTVSIPFVPPERADTEEPPEVSNRAELGSTAAGALVGKSVLIVDDEVDSRDLLATILEEHGARVTMAADAEGALRLVDSTTDLVLCDIGMPKRDGYWFLHELRRLVEGERVPVIALTAYARSDDQKRALAAGFARHVAKPTQPDVLLQAVASVIAGSPASQSAGGADT